MPTVTRPPTTTIVDGWPTKVPNVAPHLNIDEGVDTPNTADYVQAGVGGKKNEYGGFFVSADIPAGSVINSVSVRQRMQGEDGDNEAGVRFALIVGGADRAVANYGVHTGGADETRTATFSSSGITRDELVGASGGGFTISKTTTDTGGDPPLPGG